MHAYVRLPTRAVTKEQHEAFLKETPDEAQKRRQQDAGRTNISWTNEIPVEAKKRQQNEVERTTNINRHTPNDQDEDHMEVPNISQYV